MKLIDITVTRSIPAPVEDVFDVRRKHQEGWTWVLSMLAERFAGAGREKK